MEYSYIKKAVYQSPFNIYCEFEDGKKGMLDLIPYQKYGGVFSQLNDEKYAMQFHIYDGVLTWGDGELDIAPETVYHLATGSELPAWVEK